VHQIAFGQIPLARTPISNRVYQCQKPVEGGIAQRVATEKEEESTRQCNSYLRGGPYLCLNARKWNLPRVYCTHHCLASGFSGEVQIERIDLLDAAVTHQERCIIRGQSDPRGKTVGGLRKILEAQKVFEHTVFDSHAH
jgi:hypothetical protein